MSKILFACCLICLPLRHLQITSGYGFRVHPLTGRYQFHKGIDLRARSDTVFAVLPGKVTAAAFDPLLGFYIRLDHGDFETLYGHLSQVFVLTADSVFAGTPVGITGWSGRTTGEHLHFAVSFQHRPMDPIKFLNLLIQHQHKKETIPMSTYKPLSEQVANKMIADLKANTSIFQRPDNNSQSAMPFNLSSGNRYPGASALTLLMQKRDDPRWATFEQANRNRTAVNKNTIGTFINFKTQYEYQQAFKDGEPVLKQNGKPRYDRVRLDEPKEVTAKVFNAEQMRKMPAWEKEPALLSPVERAEIMLESSKVGIEHGGDDMLYDIATDTIVLPEKEHFATPEQYVAEALHQLAHREIQNSGEELGVVKEELRANLASLFLSKELNLPYDLNYHVGYTNSWAQLLKEEPGELFQAADDAQKVMDKIMNYERELDVQQDIENGPQIDQTGQQADHAVAEQPANSNPNKLEAGDVIKYKGNEFTVLAEQKNKTLKMQDASGDKFSLKPKDGLYSNLLHAKNNPLEQSQEMEQGFEQDESIAEEQEEETDYSISR